MKDPLVASRTFVTREQSQSESVEDFSTALKHIFKQAYPTEALTSTILLQRFLTGLRPPIGQQLLLRKKPGDLAEAITIAAEVEYALNFGCAHINKQNEVSVVQCPTQPHKVEYHAVDQLSKLQSSITEMTKRMEALESALEARRQIEIPTAGSGRTTARNRERDRRTCFLCGQEGHLKRNCPLNYNGPARMAGSWSRPY